MSHLCLPLLSRLASICLTNKAAAEGIMSHYTYRTSSYQLTFHFRLFVSSVLKALSDSSHFKEGVFSAAEGKQHLGDVE